MGEWGEREDRDDARARVRRSARASAREARRPVRGDGSVLPWLIALGIAAAVFHLPFFSLLLAAFFLNLALRHDASWAWIPGGFFAWRVITDFVGEVSEIVSLPIVVMSAGALLLLRDRLSDTTVKVGLVICLVLGLIAVADNDRRPVVVERDRTNIDVSVPRLNLESNGAPALPALRNRTLVVRADDADVDVRVSPDVREPEVVSGRRRITQNDEQVTVAPLDDSIEIEVPLGAKVAVRTDDGDVAIDLVGDPTLSLETADGDIDLDGYEGGDPATGEWHHTGRDPGRIEVRTDNGEIDVERVQVAR